MWELEEMSRVRMADGNFDRVFWQLCCTAFWIRRRNGARWNLQRMLACQPGPDGVLYENEFNANAGKERERKFPELSAWSYFECNK